MENYRKARNLKEIKDNLTKAIEYERKPEEDEGNLREKYRHLQVLYGLRMLCQPLCSPYGVYKFDILFVGVRILVSRLLYLCELLQVVHGSSCVLDP